MAKYYIPDNPGEFAIQESMRGTPFVWNRKTGKNKVLIPCKTWQQAENLLKKLNDGDHNGVVTA